VTYYRFTGDKSANPGAEFSATISWPSTAGTKLGDSSSNVTNDEDKVIGATLKTEVQTQANDAQIPSYNCTLEFQFTDKQNAAVVYAVNGVSWTCTSAPVHTQCTFLDRPIRSYVSLLMTFSFSSKQDFLATSADRLNAVPCDRKWVQFRNLRSKILTTSANKFGAKVQNQA